MAIIGRPNVGKSTMLNRLAGEERSIVSDIPGTTRDAVDTIVNRGERTYRFVDTAGIRRKGKTKLIAEKLSVVMARRHLEQADVALLIVDASLGVTASDANIAGYAEQSGCSVIIVMNKWDLAVEAAAEKAARELKSQETKPHVVESSYRRAANAARTQSRKHTSVVRKKAFTGKVNPAQLVEDYETIVRTRFKFLDYAPIVFLSAKTGERTEKLFDLINRVADARRRRISTGELNRWLKSVDLDRGTSPAVAQGEDLLRDAGRGIAADVYPVHQPIQAAAFQLRAVPGKPVAQDVRFPRRADPFPAAHEGKARSRAKPRARSRAAV